MLRLIGILYFCFQVSSANATPDGAISERQTLIGLTETSYYVFSYEWEVENSHFRHTQRTYIKQYDLETNLQIDAHLLSESEIHTNPDTQKQTVEPTKGELITYIEAFPSIPIQYAGFSKLPTKPFSVDRDGVFVISNGNSESVISRTEIEQRIPGLELLLQDKYKTPKVVAIHSESTRTGTRYFLLIQSGEWRDYGESFEYVISLPEN